MDSVKFKLAGLVSFHPFCYVNRTILNSKLSIPVIHHASCLRYTLPLNSLRLVSFFSVFETLYCSSRLHLFDQKYSKSSNIVKIIAI